MSMLLANRIEAGKSLALKLTKYANRSDVLVLGLPRGGVPVAFEIAKKLHAPLDICLVRKLGVPSRPELAMGAIAAGGVIIINEDILQWLHIPQRTIDKVVQEELQELSRREEAYRGDRPLPIIANKVIILVDDGIATGATLKAAIATLKQQKPAQIIVAVPVAPPSVCLELTQEIDEVICLNKPESLHSISLWYIDFSQTSDAEVKELLGKAINSEQLIMNN